MSAEADIVLADPENVAAALAAILVAAGASGENAQIVAANLVEADMVGRASHGTRLIGSYVDKLLGGAVRGTATPELRHDGGAVVRIDGNQTFGQVVGAFAVEAGIVRARRHGLCLVAIENASHLGRNAKWPELAARQGIASIHFGHGFGAAPSVAPYGGATPKLRTSPIALGAPVTGGDPIILDFSVAEISMNSVKLAAETGRRLPAGAAIRRDGSPTDDPSTVLNDLAALVPFGGFKGYGMAVFAEIFAGIIAGGDATGRGTNAMLSIYIDVARVSDLETYNARLSAFLAELRSTPPVSGHASVLVPGDRSRLARGRHTSCGLPLPPALRRSLIAAAERAGMGEASRARWPDVFSAG